jgi:hypothetical protein
MLHQPRLLATVACLLFAFPSAGLHAAEFAATADGSAAEITPIPVESDRGLLKLSMDYRYDPVGRQLWEIPRESLRPGCVYLTYAADLQTWTWSQWMGAQGFRFALGTGSVIPGEQFHLTISDAEGMRAIEARSPELARKFEIQGAKPVLRLEEDDTWRLNPNSCGARVFDERTGHRWEWHGPDQAAVVHLGGNCWRYENGRYLPAYR